MKPPAIQFPYVAIHPGRGELERQPLLPLKLTHSQQTVSATGLLDTGAMVNVLPYDLGTQLGADWNQQTIPVQLTGNLAKVEARALLITAVVATFPRVQLAFAWTKSKLVPLLLGQVNFFMEFDVCFFRSRSVFEIRPK